MYTRDCKEAIEWSQRIKSNFDYKCHWCGSTENLCAHHEIPWTGYTPETDFDDDNGICLCGSCHTILHKTGTNHSEETRNKMSFAHSGENNAMYGKKHSEETRNKMSKSQLGHKVSEETRMKMSESKSGKKHPMYGKTHTEEARKRISEANTGRIVSEEVRRKVSEFHTGKIVSYETKQKLRITIAMKQFRKLRDKGIFGELTTEGGIYV